LWRRLWNLVSQQYWFPSYTSTVCPVHGAKIVYQPDGGSAPRVGVCEKREGEGMKML